MKTTTLRSLLLAILLVSTAASAVASNPVRLTLTLDPPEILPGIETSLRIEAFNSSPSPVPMPVGMVLEVTPEKGKPYLTASGIGREGRFAIEFKEEDGSAVMVPGSGSKTFYLAAAPGAPWKYGRFWRKPGVYRLRVIADDGLMRPLNGDAFPLDAEFLVDPVASNYAQLTIVTPTGVDYEVWGMIDALDDWGWPDKLAHPVWQAYPTSSYTAYLVRTVVGDSLKQIQYYAEALAKNPRGSYGDWYRWSMAGRYYGERDGQLPDNFRLAFEYSEKARLLLEEVIRRNLEPGVVKAAREKLDQYGMSYEELKDYAGRRRDARRPHCERLAVTRVRDYIGVALDEPATSEAAKKKLQEVLRHLDKFDNEVAKTPSSMTSALAALKGAIVDLESMHQEKLIDAERGARWIGWLVDACGVSAQKAIDAAANDPAAKSARLAAAKAKYEEARDAAVEGDSKGAASRFKDALGEAQEASPVRAEGC